MSATIYSFYPHNKSATDLSSIVHKRCRFYFLSSKQIRSIPQKTFQNLTSIIVKKNPLRILPPVLHDIGDFSPQDVLRWKSPPSVDGSTLKADNQPQQGSLTYALFTQGFVIQQLCLAQQQMLLTHRQAWASGGYVGYYNHNGNYNHK